jgi:hypothetical protein
MVSEEVGIRRVRRKAVISALKGSRARLQEHAVSELLPRPAARRHASCVDGQSQSRLAASVGSRERPCAL